MSKTLSTVDDTLDRVYLYGMNGGLGYEKFENELSPNDAIAQLRSLVEKKMYELIGGRDDDEKFKDLSKYKQRKVIIEYEQRVKQRENVPKLLDQMFGGRDE